ncbi:MAG: amidase [Oricola sp.]
MHEFEKLLWNLDATALGELVRKGDVAPVELVDASITRAERTGAKINAIAERLYEDARRQASGMDRNLPFAGVPIAVKDLGISIAGVPVHWGSRARPVVPQQDSLLVTRYRSAGFIPVMTSTSSEFGLRLVTETARFGITRNPWNTSRVTGGSSGGSAALVAAGIVPVAHASDGGGSIRVPAACCGLVGMKPSRGRVPFSPDFLEGWYGMLAQHAVTRSVRDSAAMLDVSSGPDPMSPYCARPPRRSFADAAASRPEGLRVGVYRASPLGLAISTETLTALDAASALAEEAGHRVEEIALPMLTRDVLADFGRLVASAFAGQMLVEADRLRGAGRLERTTRIMRRFGATIGAAETAAAILRLQVMTRDLLAATECYDAVFMPLIAHPPLSCGGMDTHGLDRVNEVLLDVLHLTPLLRLRPLFDKMMDLSLWFTHWPAIQNVTGQPAIALPVHVTEDGLPLGIQAVGRIGDEDTLFALAGQMEEMSGWLERRAPLDVPD